MKQKKLIIALSLMLFSKDAMCDTIQAEVFCESFYANQKFKAICLNKIKDTEVSKIISDILSSF
jgi:hypothetical protein